MEPYALGVDLGTTYAAAAVARGDRAEVLTLGTRSATIPSIVLLREDGEVLTGEAAERRAVLEPSRTGREFKRRLGDPVPLLLGGTPYGAEALQAHLLRAVVDHAEEEQGGAPSVVALSHPAAYGPYKLDLVTEIGRLAGVGDVTCIPEPVAAAIEYARSEHVEPGETVAVYDLGGGTFDAAVVVRAGDGFELAGEAGGMDRFGGIDLDEAVFAHVREALGGIVERLDPKDPVTRNALYRIREDCRLAKEGLSSDTEVVIPVILPNAQTEVLLARSEFEDMLRPRLRETVQVLERVVDSAGVSFADLSRILLVGGSSRIPLVAETVRRETGRPVALDANPKHVIPLGAAVAAAASVARAEGVPSPTPTAAVGTAVGTATTDVSDDTASSAEPRPAEPAAIGEQPAATPPPEDGSARRRWRWPVAFLAVVLLLVAGAVLVLGGDDGGDSSAGGGGQPEVLRATVGDPIAVGDRPLRLAAEGTMVSGDVGSLTISVLPDEASVAVMTDVGVQPTDVAVADGRVWITAENPDRAVLRGDLDADPSRPLELEVVAAGFGAVHVAADDDGAWISDPEGGRVLRLDGDGAEVGQVAVGGKPGDIALAAGSAWVIDTAGNTVVRIDETSLEVTETVLLDVVPLAVTADDEAVYVTDREAGTLTRVSAADTTMITTAPVADRPTRPEVGPGGVWLLSPEAGTVHRYDAESLDEVQVVDVGGILGALAVDGDDLWVTRVDTGALVPISPSS